MKYFPTTYFIFCLLFSNIISPKVYSQAKSIHISGKIFSEDSEALTNCNVIIKSQYNPKQMAFTTTGEGNEFRFLLHWSYQDSVSITISHVGYKSKIINAKVISGATYYWDISLVANPKMLEDVSVLSPITRHGDTTTYNVEYFKEPTDIKLLDVINNMPGFRVDDNGIYFKEKKIRKITIDNEELFSDKINLLTKNLPADGLQKIQALENQNMNQKLKGLTGDDEVFVNLVTKKNSIFFGDMEAGAGTLDRYKINPVIFQLRNKIKAGIMADWDNSGKTMTPGDSRQLMGDEYDKLVEGTMRKAGIFIPNFNQSRYVNNHLGDVRLSLNWNMSSALKNNTEISFITDNRLQTSIENSQILSGDSLVQRSAINRVRMRPHYLQATNKVQWEINKRSALEAKIIFTSDRNKYQDNNEVNQEGLSYFSKSKINNNWNTFSIHMDYTSRISVRKAVEIRSDMGFFDLPQTVVSISPNWQTLFRLPDSSYQQFYDPYFNRVFSSKTYINYLVRKGKRLFIYNVTGEYQWLKSSADLFFGSVTGKPVIYNEHLSGQGIYSLKRLTSNFNYNFYISKLLFATSSTVGVAEIATTGNFSRKKKYVMPVLQISISQKSKIFKKAENKIEIKYQQSPFSIYAYRSNIYPTGIAMFEQKKNFGLPNKELSLGHDITLFSLGASSLTFSQNLSFNFANSVSTPAYNGIVFISTDSVIRNHVTKNYFNLVSYTFPIVFLRAKCIISNNFSYSENWINSGNKIELSHFNMDNLSVEFRRNWQRQIFLSLKSNLSFINNHFRRIGNDDFLQPTVNLLNTFSLKAKITSTIETNFSIDFIQNNIKTQQAVSAIFADLELIKTFTKSKWSVRLKLANIFNEKQYLVVNRYIAAYQSFYTIPLIRRNLLCTLRFEL